MPSIIKLKGTEVGVTNATSVDSATLVRIYAPANSEITVTDTSNTALSFTMPGGSVEFLEKLSTDTVASDVEVLVTPIAYKA